MYENPCKPDCPKRTPTCHSDCPEYVAFEILNGIEREKKFQEKQKKWDCYQSTRFYRDKRKKRAYADRRDAQ